jgi:hypothetical protein
MNLIAADTHIKITTPIIIALPILLLCTVITPVSADNSHDWRFNAHGRSIDIDICVRCTSTILGLPGPPGDTRQTIVTLHDDVEGHAAGWDPSRDPVQGGPATITFQIQSQVDLEAGTFIEAIFTMPQSSIAPAFLVGDCTVDRINPSTDHFNIACVGQGPVNSEIGPEEGSVLTYVIMKP